LATRSPSTGSPALEGHDAGARVLRDVGGEAQALQVKR
jgi:hypothetical protein